MFDATAEADIALPPLTIAQADALILLSVEEFARQGYQARYDGLGGMISGSDLVDLHALAQAAAMTSTEAWPKLVSRFVHGAFAEDDSPPDAFDHVSVLLVPQLRAGPTTGEVREVLAGIYAGVVLDYVDRSSATLSGELIEKYGGWDVVMHQAMANLRHLPAPRVRDIIADEDRDDATVHVLRYEDPFGASRVLLWQELLASIGVEAPSQGVLVAIPNRHVLVVHVPRGEGVIAAVRRMLLIVKREHADQPGPISPHLFYLGPQQPQQVSTLVDGEVEVEVRGPFKQALASLGLVAD